MLSRRRFIDYPARLPPTLTLCALTLCLETSFRHAVYLGRRFHLPIRRLPALLLELLTIRLVTVQEFASLQVGQAPRLAEEGFRRTGSARGCGMRHREGRHGPALEMAVIAAGGAAPRCRVDGQR